MAEKSLTPEEIAAAAREGAAEALAERIKDAEVTINVTPTANADYEPKRMEGDA